MRRAKIQKIGWILLMCSVIGMTASVVKEVTAPKSEGILYHIQKDDNSMYLLGSIHIGTSDMARFGDDITSAIASSEIFVFECDTSSAETVQMINEKMMLPDGDHLKNHLEDSTYEMLTEVATLKSLPMDQLEAKKPWAVANTLAVYTTADALGVSDISDAIAYGVENQVLQRLTDRSVTFAYLETAMEQLDTLENFSPSLQDYLISNACEQMLNPEKQPSLGDAGMSEWSDWWQAGDADAFAQAYRSSMQEIENEALLAEYQQALMTDRHIEMANKLDAMLSSDGEHHYFVTIGLLHLVLEEDSVLTLLENRGYTVERI